MQPLKIISFGALRDPLRINDTITQLRGFVEPRVKNVASKRGLNLLPTGLWDRRITATFPNVEVVNKHGIQLQLHTFIYHKIKLKFLCIFEESQFEWCQMGLVSCMWFSSKEIFPHTIPLFFNKI